MTEAEREQIMERALQIAADIEAKCGPYSAEIVPDCAPLWHPLGLAPGQEFKAVAYLSARGFGVFLPKFSRDASLKLDGVELCGGRRLVFPGTGFIFVWDVMRHWRRIRACPGVQRILVDGAQRPIIVNDATMDYIQALQYGLDPGKPKRRRYSKTKRSEEPDERVDYVLIKTLSTIGGAEGLDRAA